MNGMLSNGANDVSAGARISLGYTWKPGEFQR